MYAVCAHYCDTTILVNVFKKKKDADTFASKPTTIEWFDSKDVNLEYVDTGLEYTIYPDEMWVEPYEEIPFCYPIKVEELEAFSTMTDELPF